MRVYCRAKVHYLVKDLRETLPFSNITHREEDHKPNPATEVSFEKRIVFTEGFNKEWVEEVPILYKVFSTGDIHKYPREIKQRFHQRSNALVL